MIVRIKGKEIKGSMLFTPLSSNSIIVKEDDGFTTTAVVIFQPDEIKEILERIAVAYPQECLEIISSGINKIIMKEVNYVHKS